MSKSTKRIPDGFHGVIPHLVVKGASPAIEFYKAAFGAWEMACMPGPDGKTIMHADLEIGGGHLLLVDEFSFSSCKAPSTVGGTSVPLHLYVEDVDAVFSRAIKLGGKVTMPVMDMFWGDRYGKLLDPFGHEWSLASHLEDLTPAEIQERGKTAMAKMGKPPA
jgi:PhnB protein